MATSWAWWSGLISLAGLNTSLLLTTLSKTPHEGSGDGGYRRTMRLLAFPFFFQTTWRCMFPCDYTSRSAFFDTPLSSALGERLLAAVGEACFGAQLAVATSHIATEVLESTPASRPASLKVLSLVRSLAWFIVPLDLIGQLCATTGTITQNQLYFLFESFCWIGIFATAWACGVPLCVLRPRLNGPHGSDAKLFVRLLCTAAPLALSYQIFGYTVDCWHRYETDNANGAIYQPLGGAAAWDALVRRVPTREWSVWQVEWLWMSLYFSFGTWASIWLMRAPRLDIKSHRS